ncbi:MAG: hypothetical protein AAF092_08480 [Pseudomonadota bacterium]
MAAKKGKIVFKGSDTKRAAKRIAYYLNHIYCAKRPHSWNAARTRRLLARDRVDQ